MKSLKVIGDAMESTKLNVSTGGLCPAPQRYLMDSSAGNALEREGLQELVLYSSATDSVLILLQMQKDRHIVQSVKGRELFAFGKPKIFLDICPVHQLERSSSTANAPIPTGRSLYCAKRC
eukprot:768194-Hanusia_phi.AAC.4